jgi:hypothetical protein
LKKLTWIELDRLATVLNENSAEEKPIAEPYVLELTKAINGDKKGKHILDVSRPLFCSIEPRRA